MISEGVSGVYRDGTVNRQPGQHTPCHVMCATDGVHLQRGLGQLPQALIGSPASEGAVQSGEIVEALPFVELGVDELGVVVAGNLGRGGHEAASSIRPTNISRKCA